MLPANRSPPMCETSQVSSGWAWSSARATGRPRSAQQASWRPLVQTQKSDPSYGASPVEPPSRNAAEVEVEHLARVGDGAGLQARRDRVGVGGEDAQAVAVAASR